MANYDLTVSNLTLTPATPVVNDLVTLSVTVNNIGTEATPSGIIHGVAFQVDGVTMTWSDDWTTSIPAGGSRVQTANGGWTPSGAKWLATIGQRTIRAIVDDVNRFPDELNKTNNEVSLQVEVQAEASPPGAGQVCPFVEWNYVTFQDGLIRMMHRAARNRAYHRLNSTFVREWSPGPGTNGIVGTPHVVSAECRLSGSAAGYARLYVRGFNKLNGIDEVESQILVGSSGIGNWTTLTATFTHIPHNNPKVPDALTALLTLDHNGYGTCEWRNVTIEIPPV
jgi:CARDB protein